MQTARKSVAQIWLKVGIARCCNALVGQRKKCFKRCGRIQSSCFARNSVSWRRRGGNGRRRCAVPYNSTTENFARPESELSSLAQTFRGLSAGRLHRRTRHCRARECSSQNLHHSPPPTCHPLLTAPPSLAPSLPDQPSSRCALFYFRPHGHSLQSVPFDWGRQEARALSRASARKQKLALRRAPIA